jgi:hypothetical protein
LRAAVADARGARLDEGALQFGRELCAVELREQRVDLGRGTPALQVDDVELLLDAQQGEVAHDTDAKRLVLQP